MHKPNLVGHQPKVYSGEDAQIELPEFQSSRHLFYPSRFMHLFPSIGLFFQGSCWVTLVCLSLLGKPQWPGSSLKPVVLPGLAPLNKGSRQYIESHYQSLSGLLSRSDVPAQELARAFGVLGQIYQAHGFRNEALVAYENATLIMPDDARWPYYEGLVYMELAQLSNSAEAFQRALQAKPDDLHSLVRFGHVLLDLNQPEKAKDPLEKAIKRDPNCALALYGLGVIASQFGHHQQAVTYFEKVLAEQPEASLINYPLGMAYRRLGNREKARLHLENRGEDPILFADPYLAQIKGVKTVSSLRVVLDMAANFKSEPGHSFEAFLLKNLSEKKGVDTYLKDALAHRKNQTHQAPPEELARLHFAIAVVLGQKAAWGSARTHLDTALSFDPQFLLAQIRLGDVCGQLEEYQEGERGYQRALSLDPTNEEALFKHALCLIRLDRNTEAKADLKRLVEINPSHVQARLRLAKMIEGPNREAAISHYRALAEMEMGNAALANVHGSLAKLLQAGGNLVETVNHYESALSLDSTRLDFRVNLAAAFGFLNRYDEAASQYAAILEQIPDNEMARLGQVAALVLGQNYGPAIERLEDGLRIHPGNPRLTHLLARQLAVAPVPNLRDGLRAEILARACYEKRNSIPYGETLAMALAQTGRFEDAVALQERLVRAAAENPSQRAKLKANLALYRDQRLCCDVMEPSVLLPP